MNEVFVMAAVRTAIGKFGGSLANTPAADLGAITIESALSRAHISTDVVDEVLMGCVLQAGQGQNPARQAALKAAIPDGVPSTTINKVCGSGLKAVMLAAQSILLGDADTVVAGGVENMSMAPYLIPNARYGYRMGNGTLVDEMIRDGLWCAAGDYHMGITAENIAERWGISRAEQDEFAAVSQQKAERAVKTNRFAEEITPVQLKVKGDVKEFRVDEYVRFGVTSDALSKLKPAFKKDGTVTAGNASGINDGAAAMVLMSGDKARSLGITPIARFVAGASAGVDPSIMGMGPVEATKKVLAKAGWVITDLDLIEANEAFAAQSLAVARELGFPMDRVNVNGGAIALGHPIGASGARILVTLLHEMQKQGARKGLATLCIGGGQGAAVLVEM